MDNLMNDDHESAEILRVLGEAREYINKAHAGLEALRDDFGIATNPIVTTLAAAMQESALLRDRLRCARSQSVSVEPPGPAICRLQVEEKLGAATYYWIGPLDGFCLLPVSAAPPLVSQSLPLSEDTRFLGIVVSPGLIAVRLDPDATVTRICTEPLTYRIGSRLETRSTL